MLSASQITFERYFEPVFHPVSFELDAGRLLLITGTNGCGKTTLIRVLAGVLDAHDGKLDYAADNMTYVGHYLALKDDLSVEENLRFMRGFLGQRDISVADVISRMGLEHQAEQLARTLSAGQRKRCALGRLLLSNSALWLLDEPYSNLDIQGMELVDELLIDHLRSGGACVLATHGAHRPDWPDTLDYHLKSGREK